MCWVGNGHVGRINSWRLSIVVKVRLYYIDPQERNGHHRTLTSYFRYTVETDFSCGIPRSCGTAYIRIFMIPFPLTVL